MRIGTGHQVDPLVGGVAGGVAVGEEQGASLLDLVVESAARASKADDGRTIGHISFTFPVR